MLRFMVFIVSANPLSKIYSLIANQHVERNEFHAGNCPTMAHFYLCTYFYCKPSEKETIKMNKTIQVFVYTKIE